MIAIIDYGAGNLFSVQNALTYLNETFWHHARPGRCSRGATG